MHRQGSVNQSTLIRGAVLAVCLLLLIWVWSPSGQRYPRVESREAAALLQLVNTAVGSRDTAALQLAEQRFENLDLPENERAVFRKILDLAGQEQWEEAAAICRQFAAAQAR